MRRIEKRSQEPPQLLAYRKSADPNRSYDDLPDKDALRLPLLEDQGHLCCYCMRRIAVHDMKIEHYHSQADFPMEALDWRNMLAACDGGQGRPSRAQTCDTRKGNQRLTIDPRSDSVQTLRYLGSGRLEPRDPKYREDIEQHLNLNHVQLTRARAQALDNLRNELVRRFGRHTWRRQDLQRYLERLRNQRPYREFLGLYEYWLEKKLARR